NLVVSIDGMSNQFEIHNTNVVELHSCILSATLAHQAKYYNCGIGTYAPNQNMSRWKYCQQKVENALDLAFALNFKDIILKACQWLSQMYQPGDKIFLFGFSWGAFQVGTLAGMIEKVGLVDSGNEEMIPLFVVSVIIIIHSSYETSGYEIYSERHKEQHKWIHIIHMCFFATILHWPRSWETTSTRSVQHICIFCHALALDELQVKFLLEFVTGGGSTQSSDGSATSNPTNVNEV
ncbi:hypothetical protein C8R44DRAFT_617859, partial [Mycena epipterygia]